MSLHSDVLDWLENNRLTLEEIIENEEAGKNELLLVEPKEFHEEIQKQYKDRIKKLLHDEISKTTGIQSDIIMEVLEEYCLFIL